MELVEFGAEDAPEVARFVDLVNVCNEVDAPWLKRRTRLRQLMKMRHSWEGEPSRYFLAVVEDQPVGTLVAYASDYDNRDLVWFQLAIAPAYRRRGYGAALLARAEDLAGEMGRPLAMFDGWEAPATTAFAARHGYPVRSVSVSRVQDLTGSVSERARFAALRDEAGSRSTGYDLVRLVGRTPEEWIERLVTATGAINDAPTDDLEIEDEVFSVARVRAYEDAQLASQNRFLRILAVERATGTVAGHTVVVVDAEQPAHGEQHDTVVVPAHRGHRLGMRLKADMLCWLAEREPQLRSLETENAETNGPMVTINEELGYQVANRQLVFQRRLD